MSWEAHHKQAMAERFNELPEKKKQKKVKKSEKDLNLLGRLCV